MLTHARPNPISSNSTPEHVVEEFLKDKAEKQAGKSAGKQMAGGNYAVFVSVASAGFKTVQRRVDAFFETGDELYFDKIPTESANIKQSVFYTCQKMVTGGQVEPIYQKQKSGDKNIIGFKKVAIKNPAQQNADRAS